MFIRPIRGLALAFAGMLAVVPARADILAMVNYASKGGQVVQKEGIAILDVDPTSAGYGKIISDIPLPKGLKNHHIFYNKDASKAYVTVFGENALYVLDLKKNPYRLSKISVPDCEVGEDVVFSNNNSRWYLTCMGSSTVIVGDALKDKPIRTIKTAKPHPHGIAINESIDRILITGTIKHDLTDPGETITAIEASTGKVLESYKLSNKPSPSGVAPVEVLFVPGANPPVAYVTNMFGGTLWAATWKPATKKFAVQQVYDFASIKTGVPLEIYFNKKADRLYVTTAKPGKFHVFDISAGPLKPKLLKTISAAAGAHHVGITPDEKLAFVQNNLLDLKGMNDGSITVMNLEKGTVIGRIDTFKKAGLNPNLIVLLPAWYHPAGH